jgi:hypothetical protein
LYNKKVVVKKLTLLKFHEGIGNIACSTILDLIPMLRTKPDETRPSIACHVVSRDMVVSISKTPSSPKALSVVPTPAHVRNVTKLLHTCRDGSSHIIMVWPNIKQLYKLENKYIYYKLYYIKNKRETQEN